MEVRMNEDERLDALARRLEDEFEMALARGLVRYVGEPDFWDDDEDEE
jgi:hypothetical protein